MEKAKLNSVGEGLNELIKDSPWLKDLRKEIEIVMQKLPDATYELSRYGWYIDEESTPGKTIELSQWLENGEIDMVNEWFKNRYDKEKIKFIEKNLIQEYPKRKSIIKTAFKHHFKSDYISSITILLTQVDGMFYDKTGENYFSKKRSGEIKKFNFPKSGLIDALIKPLKDYTLINASANYLDDYPVKLNRHEVLHGTVTDFDSEINSLKVISFINFMGVTLHQAFKKPIT